MEHPSVSVIMPVFNAGKYLRKAIESILQQTFTDFELIIVNDHSTDSSDIIISSIKDERIIYLLHERNMGVVAAMNKGLELARGKYIAVMHADDIALPKRLEQQVSFLKNFPFVAVLAGKAIFIDNEDKETGFVWKLDEKTSSFERIKAAMRWQNCISHPTVMMRSETAKKYKYSSSEMHKGFAVEDYPLWLNILSDGYVIEKLREPVLLYRAHQTSATSRFLRRRNPFLTNYYSKKSYLRERKKKGPLNSFDKKVQMTMYLDYIKAQLKQIKKLFISR